ncbi:MAG: YheT family hydrolase [Casimicrobiaceae bacterium]
MSGTYRAPRWLAGAHAQTIYPALRTPPAVRFRRERVDTPDGDFVDFDWLDAATPAADTPTVVLFHGLEGGSASHYALALMRRLRTVGWRGVIPHFRGCSGEPNRLPRAYHSGDYAEIGWMLATVRARVPAAPLYAVGVSLGGSALLNWIGRQERQALTTLAAAAAVSAPLDLTAAGIAIGQGFNRIYARHFLSTLVPKALAMAQRFPGTLDAAAIRRARSMHAFDDVVTAPLHGFGGVCDYWQRASSKPWLGGVAVPTLVLNAKNDPFVPASSLPATDAVSRAVRLEQPAHGGHAGFATSPFPGSLDWLPGRLLQFFARSQ